MNSSSARYSSTTAPICLLPPWRAGAWRVLLPSFDEQRTIPFHVGAELRYRHRLDSKQSIDFGIGLSLFGQSSLSERVALYYGLVKWNPVHWFGIALRPEMQRKGGQGFEYIWPGNQLVKVDDPYRFHLSLGIEIGGSLGR